jgi:hypothetical protein
VNDELEMMREEAVVVYVGIILEQLRKTTKNISQDSRSLGRDLNPETSEYEAEC